MTGNRGPVVAVLLMCLGGAVVESAAAGSPTKASWVKSANAVCAPANARIRALPAITAENVLSETRVVHRTQTRLSTQLAAIPRPAGAARSTIASFVAAARQSADLVRQLIPALQRHDSVAIARLSASGQNVGRRLVAIANRLGAHVCAQEAGATGR